MGKTDILSTMKVTVVGLCKSILSIEYHSISQRIEWNQLCFMQSTLFGKMAQHACSVQEDNSTVFYT